MNQHYYTKLIIMCSIMLNLNAQTLNITNNYTKKVEVIAKGSRLIGSGSTERLEPTSSKTVIIKPGKTKSVHIDVMSSVTFSELVDPYTGTAPLILQFAYPMYLGAYTAAKNAESDYEITPDGEVKRINPTKKK